MYLFLSSDRVSERETDGEREKSDASNVYKYVSLSYIVIIMSVCFNRILFKAIN